MSVTTQDTALENKSVLAITANLGSGVTPMRLLEILDSIAGVIDFQVRLSYVAELSQSIFNAYLPDRVQIDEQSTFDPVRLKQILDIYGIGDDHDFSRVARAVEAGRQRTRARFMGALTDVFLQAENGSSLFEKIPPATPSELSIERMTYRNPLEIIVAVGSGLIIAAQGVTWIIDKTQTIKLNQLNIEKTKLEIAQMESDRNKTPGDRHRDASFRHLVEGENTVEGMLSAALRAAIQVSISAELPADKGVLEYPEVKRSVERLLTLPVDTSASIQEAMPPGS